MFGYDGFAGLKWTQDGLVLSNHLPEEIEKLSFNILLRNDSVRVKMEKNQVFVDLAPTSLLTVKDIPGGVLIS